MSTVKYLTFDTLNSKKPLSSSILNVIIFGIDEQCNLKLKTVRFTIVKLILFFYSDGAFFFFFGLSHFLVFLPYLSFLLWASNHFSLSLSPTKPRPEHQAKSIFIAMVFFFFFSLWFDGRFGSGCVDYGFDILGYFTPWVPIWAYFGGFVIWF